MSECPKCQFIEGCRNPVYARGVCLKHYHAARREAIARGTSFSSVGYSRKPIGKANMAYAKCPHCGAEVDQKFGGYYQCRTTTKSPHHPTVECCRRQLATCQKQLSDRTIECGRLEARVEAAERRERELREVITKALDDLRAAPELNPRNFDEDDAMRLNDAVCQVFCDLESAMLGRDDL